jgi:hypothetical protein
MTTRRSEVPPLGYAWVATDQQAAKQPTARRGGSHPA